MKILLPAARIIFLNLITLLGVTHFLTAQVGEWEIVDTVAGRLWRVVSPSDSAFVIIGTGQILRSDDDGRTWAVVYSGGARYPDFADVSFGTAMTGIAVGKAASGYDAFFRTLDGGKSWEEIESNGSGYSAHFIDANFGVIANSTGMVKTRDGGETWESITFAQPAYLLDLWMLDTLQGVRVTGEGVLRTEDGGHTWFPISVESNPLRGVLTFADREHGLLIGKDQIAFGTADGGRTWTQGALTEGFEWWSASMQDSMHAVAVGYRAGINRTTDGGRTWRNEDSPAQWGFYDVALSRNGTAIVLGQANPNGPDIILRSAPIPSGIAESTTSLENAVLTISTGRAGDHVVVDFLLPERSLVIASICDALGKEVLHREIGVLEAGSFREIFDVSALPSGAYYLSLQTPTRMMAGSFLIGR